MARDPIRREPEPKPEPPKAAPPTPAAEAQTTATAPTAERPKVALHLGKAAAPAVYATPYGSEPASFDPKTGLKIAPAKSAA
jgi:hypothetical protein